MRKNNNNYVATLKRRLSTTYVDVYADFFDLLVANYGAAYVE